MKLKNVLLILLGGCLLLSSSLYSQQNNKPVDIEERLKDYVLNDFEDSEDWRAFSTTPLGDTRIRKTIQQGPFVFDDTKLNDKEKKMFGSARTKPNHVLGVKTFFKDRGFDRVEIKPPHEYVIKGMGRQFSVWVLGRKFKHSLNIKLRDYQGKIHKLKVGSLDFLGWRKMAITIPGWLPQSSRYSLYDRNLHFVSLFVESNKHEVPGNFYFYVDQLEIKVDKTGMVYPGSLIKDTW